MQIRPRSWSGHRHRALALLALAALPVTPALAERGSDGALTLVYWQAPTTLNPYQSSGTKDIEAASLVLEPLARFAPDGGLIPWLARDIPSLENGGISADRRQITWHLRADVLWSDGTALTARDVVATAHHCLDAPGGCAQRGAFADIHRIEALDDSRVRITFTGPKPVPFAAFVGSGVPVLQADQLERCAGVDPCPDLAQRPVGTGPFAVSGFAGDGTISYQANPRYRDPDLPRFATVTLRGGGDALAAARAVMVEGAADYAWNLQLAPDMLAELTRGGRGSLVTGFGNIVERIELNLTDPDPALPPDVRSTRATAHPLLSDARLRQALSLAIDRDLLVEIGYGPAGRPACNLIQGPRALRSNANDDCLHPDPDRAAALLDAAGWVTGADGIRSRDGRRLELVYLTSTNAVRQDVQTLIRQWWREIGVDTVLRHVPAAVLFGSDPQAAETLERFPADLVMFANAATGPDPEAYLGRYRCDRDPGPETGWQGTNIARFCDPVFDLVQTELGATADPDRRRDLAIMLNDILVQSFAVIPLVDRGRVSARADDLDGVAMNAWDSELWNIHLWRRR